ncbi:MAG TPA: AMP-binding protein [Terriglobia bacterium]|nr:AMP-binding protein [Terriglobia bacterium]
MRQFVERRMIGDSVPRLVRWGKSLPPSLIRRMQADAFRRVVLYAASRQKFFSRKLQQAGIRADRVRTPQDLGDVFTTPEDLLSFPEEDFLCAEPQAVFETTGTSGGPKRVGFSYDELDLAGRYEAAAFYENGMRPPDRVVCTFDAGYWISSWVTFLACKQLGVFCSAVGKPHPQEVYDRMVRYRYNVIVADPTWLVSLSEIAQQRGVLPVKLIFAAGDRMTEAYRNYVQQVWQAPVILGYGSTEMGGGAGMECHERHGYHLDEFNLLFEIIEPDSEGYGELVVTTLSRRTWPLIRYRVRDITRFLEGSCPCGTTVRRIAPIRGRRDEMVVMGAGNMYPEIFEKVLEGVQGISGNWQVAVRQEGLRDILEFRLELTNGIAASAVEHAVQKNLESRYPDVWANQVCGMYRLAFRFFTPQTLVHGRKRKRLVDERGE